MYIGANKYGLLPNGTSSTESDINSLIEKLDQLIELPKDETPSIATITDVTKLNSQLFYKNAENGDKILIYPNARKAMLYRPSTNKVIEVGVVSINEQIEPQATQVPLLTTMATAIATSSATVIPTTTTKITITQTIAP